MKILIVDDDINICELVKLYLLKAGYEPLIAYNGIKAMQIFNEEQPSLVVLDVMLPGTNGVEICKTIRKISNVPIIMLTAKGEFNDRITGLEAGADDYVCKPFDPNELVARIKAVLRRTETIETASGIIEYENLVLDISNYKLEVNGAEIEAPPKEIELLYHLASNPNKVFTRDQLLYEVWGFEYSGDTTRTVDVHVKRIREKIDGASENWEVKTVWGVGYKFEVKN